VKSVAMIQGDLYCKPCFMKVFKEKGSYASFGPKTLPKWEGEKPAKMMEPTTPDVVAMEPVTPVPDSPVETATVEPTAVAE